MESRKKKNNFFFKKIFYPRTLNSFCFVEKKYLWFCLCMFKSDTVKSDENDDIFKDIIQTVCVYFTSFTVFSGDIKKKKKL